jgi:hypothetical protein
MSKVTIATHPDTGAVITQSKKNAEWGTIRVESENVSFENGIINKGSRSAFINGKMSDLESLGLKPGQVMPGRIVKQESFTPFYDNQPAKINPKTGEVVLTEGRETFLNYVYTADVNAPDVFVKESAKALAGAGADDSEMGQ